MWRGLAEVWASSDHSDHTFGNLTVTDEFWIVGKMPFFGCEFYIDEKKPENCRVNFDANNYSPNGMRALLDRYIQFLRIASRHPEQPVDTLLAKLGDMPLRWKFDGAYEVARTIWASTPLLPALWKPIKRHLLRF